MRQSENLMELFAALSEAQGEIEDAIKDSTNPHFRSKYADLASVRAAIRGPFSKHGLAISQWPRIGGNSVEVETILSHKSGQFIAETISCPVPQMTAQSIGSAITYLRRYSMMAVSGVAPDDDDGNEASQPHPTRQERWSGKAGTNAREEEEQASRYYVTNCKVKFTKIDDIDKLREWWEAEKPIMNDLFDGKDDPLYIELRSAFAAHGEDLKKRAAPAASEQTPTGKQIDDAIPY